MSHLNTSKNLFLQLILVLFLQALIVIEINPSTQPDTSDTDSYDMAGKEDPSTIQGKFMVGYQGWFFCEGDGAPIEPGHHGWIHWLDKPLKNGGRITFDMWPSTSQLTPEELYPLPGLSLPPSPSDPTNGDRPANVFSSRNPVTVRRHFRWMREYEIAGVFLQRFLSQVNQGDTGLRRLRDEVGGLVRQSAEAEGRVWSVMYDVSGIKGDMVEEGIKKDWEHLINDQMILESPMYLRQGTKPIIGIWGMGFRGDNHSPESLLRLITWLKQVTPGGAYIFAGVPSRWREVGEDMEQGEGFDKVWGAVDCLSPWYVGRFADNEGADHWKGMMRDDMALMKAQDQRASGLNFAPARDYAPVVFPGFAWENLHGGPPNEIPRNGGEFLWRQLYNARDAGAGIIYGAMFDEYDEATALMHSEPLHRNTPQELPFLSLDADGEVLPEDWYLRICALAARALKSTSPLPETFPRLAIEHFHNPESQPAQMRPTLHPLYIPSSAPQESSNPFTRNAPAVCVAGPPALPPRLPARNTGESSGVGRRVPPMPVGGMMKPVVAPPARSAERPVGPATPPPIPGRLDNARLQATGLMNKALADDRAKDAQRTFGKLAESGKRMATPERQQQVMAGIGKVGAGGKALFDNLMGKAEAASKK